MSDPSEVALLERALDQAQALVELGRYEQALPLLAKALAQAPDDDLLHCRMADLHYFLDDLENSEKHAKNALSLNPNNVFALFRLSWVFLAKHNFDEALETANTLIRIEPEDASNLYTLAWSQYHNGYLHKALESAQSAVKLDPENADLHGLLADLHFNKRAYVEAEAHYREALRHNPESAHIHGNLGGSLAAQHKIVEASQHLLAAVKLEPGDAQLRDRLFDMLHHEIMDKEESQRKEMLDVLDSSVQYFYQDQLNRRGWFEKLRIGSLVSLWLLGLGVLMAFFTWVTGDDPAKMIRFVLFVGFVYIALFVIRVVGQRLRGRKFIKQ